jgi:type II secretory pathway component PulK
VLALLALTLGALIALTLTQRATEDSARTRALVGWDQTYLDALASEAWACRHLEALMTAPAQAAGEAMPRYVLVDVQGRFNLNDLVASGSVAPAQYLRLVRLLDVLGLPAELAARIIDWMDTDAEVTWPGGAETERYRALRPARRPADRPLGTLGELQDVYGMRPETLRRLLPHVAVLPGSTPINVNSATPEVLRALVPGLTPQGAAALAARRQQRPYQTVTEFVQDPAVRDLAPDASGLTTRSEYFELQTRLATPDAAIVMRSLILAHGRGAAFVVRRQLGYW